MAIVFLLLGLIVFAAIGVPLAFSIGASCITYLSAARPMFLSMMPQRIWNGVYSELMIAMPLFMLAGELMNTGGITKRIINFCMELLRPVRERTEELLKNKDYLEQTYRSGAEKAARIANRTLAKVYRKIGFVAK